MSSAHIARLFLLVITLSTVVLSYSVIAAGGAGDEPSGIRHHWRPAAYERSEFPDGMAPSYDDEGRNKRGMDEEDTQLSKRTNLKRLVILSARGFGKK